MEKHTTRLLFCYPQKIQSILVMTPQYTVEFAVNTQNCIVRLNWGFTLRIKAAFPLLLHGFKNLYTQDGKLIHLVNPFKSYVLAVSIMFLTPDIGDQGLRSFEVTLLPVGKIRQLCQHKV